jgi:hypothetical protein
MILRFFRTPEMYFLKAGALAEASNFYYCCCSITAVTSAVSLGTTPVITVPTDKQYFAENF